MTVGGGFSGSTSMARIAAVLTLRARRLWRSWGKSLTNLYSTLLNGEGREVVFSLFAEDATGVMKDLQTLKRVLED